ncbi:AAA family ATPase [Maribacter antarcticus]|uniref:AAA family ATPase n=1 Tax=Maribacter antarcticus TaxID=505250 RepID=UPI00047D5601|nr:AAA family ATPase [Maribacter antarcticus]
MSRTVIINKLFSNEPEFKSLHTFLLKCSDQQFDEIIASTIAKKESAPLLQLKIRKQNLVNLSKLKHLQEKIPEPTKLKSKSAVGQTFQDKSIYTALDLYNLNIAEVPKLLNPFFQKVGIAALVGTSDSGKSTFLRQLSLAIVLKQETFLGFELECKYNSVIYVSTEDDSHTVSYSIRKQINHLKNEKSKLDVKLLSKLSFMFDSDNLLKNLEKKLIKQPVDLVIIDAFADVFTKEINANTQVRQFLNGYDQLAKKYGFLILFLHHTGKRTNSKIPSKDNIIGSQAFEAKMRSVIELKPQNNNPNRKDLWVLKANFLELKHKNKSYILDFGKDLLFSYTGNRGTSTESKTTNPKLINKVRELSNKGMSVRKIEEELKGTEYEIGKSTVNKILQDYKG